MLCALCLRSHDSDIFVFVFEALGVVAFDKHPKLIFV